VTLDAAKPQSEDLAQSRKDAKNKPSILGVFAALREIFLKGPCEIP
jgi:hypothetical protein